MTPKIMTLPLNKIVIDKSINVRSHDRQEVIDDYLEAYKAGKKLPPVVCFYDGVVYNVKDQSLLADGKHRFLARKKGKFKDIEVELRAGSERDAAIFAASANTEHGMRRSQQDKIAAVKMILKDKEWIIRPATWIADVCKVTPRMVHDVLKQLKIKRETVIGTNGVHRRAYLDKEVRKHMQHKAKELRKEGKTIPVIAEKLGIAPATVHTYLKSNATETVPYEYKITQNAVSEMVEKLERHCHLKAVGEAVDILMENLVPLTFEEVEV